MPRSRYVPQRHSKVWAVIAVAVILLLAAVVFTFAASLVITRSADSHMIDSPEAAPVAEAAIVLGARVYSNGSPSPMLADRLATAVTLYKEGKVGKILLSGDHGTTTYDELNAMLEYCLDRGVPDKDVFTDHAGFDTYDTMYRAREVFKVKDALVVTQEFHLPRAVYTARALGIEATGVVADLRPYQAVWRNSLREFAARTKAFFQLHVTKPEPRFLGPAIPIHGDGRATRG